MILRLASILLLTMGPTAQANPAPTKDGQLTCQDHSPDCGFVYIGSVLRFTERKDPDETRRSVAELWFQRAAWVMAKPFVREAKGAPATPLP